MLTKLVISAASRKHKKVMSKLETPPHLAASLTPTPWLAEICYDAAAHGRVNRMGGTGAIISERHVLTCAHIFVEELRVIDIPVAERTFFVRYGSEKLGQGTIGRIQDIILHPNFSPNIGIHTIPGGQCDLAILVLDGPVDAEPLPITKGHHIPNNALVSTFGWPDGMEATENLHQVNTSVLPITCGITGKATAREMVLANFVGRGQMGVTYGGSPVLKFPEGNEPAGQLVGIISRGAHGLSTEKTLGPPAIAADLAWHRDWIREICAATPGA